MAVIPLDVVGVRVEMPSNQPVVLLREHNGDRVIPIWIGPVEASAIAFAQQGVIPSRPLTHDLFRDTLGVLGVTLTEVRITDMRDGVFYASMILRAADGGVVEISARPSDAIALALRAQAPVTGTSELIEQTAIEMPAGEDDLDGDEAEQVDPEAAVRQFREFLDQITPEDFAGPDQPST